MKEISVPITMDARGLITLGHITLDEVSINKLTQLIAQNEEDIRLIGKLDENQQLKSIHFLSFQRHKPKLIDDYSTQELLDEVKKRV